MKQLTDIITKIDEWGEKTPEKIAYELENKSYTYQALKEQSDAFGAYLLKSDLKPGPILIIGEFEFSLLPLFLGTIKSNRGYIPVESHTPVERLGLIYEVAQPALVISLSDTIEGIPVDLFKKEVKEILTTKIDSVAFPKRDLTKDFYTIFTSGTTGKPKGVAISHENLLSFVNWELQDFPLSETDRFLQQAPFSFDLSVMSLYPALALGATLVPLTKKTIEDFKLLFTTLPQLDLSVWVSTPSFMDICLMNPEFNEEKNPNLKTFLFCGEELTKQTAEKLQQAFPSSRIFNTYGPTEATVAISQVEITPDMLAVRTRLPIGYIKDDTVVKIVDEALQEVKKGESGEILIGGPSVSRGYVHNEEKTKEAFITLTTGEKFYRTKDRGHFEKDLLMYEGRMDFQVKLHGFRMELEDIDQNLMTLDLVKQACVVPKFQGNKVQSLVAFVVPFPHEFPSAFALTKHLKAQLGEKVMSYMVPQRFQYLESLPLTQNGKIDRKSLMAEVNGGKA